MDTFVHIQAAETLKCWTNNRVEILYAMTLLWREWRAVELNALLLTWPICRTGATRWDMYQMKTFYALLAICAVNSPVPGEFTAQRPVTQSFDVFFDLHPNTRLSKQWWGWWFETPSCPLWRHRNGLAKRHLSFDPKCCWVQTNLYPYIRLCCYWCHQLHGFQSSWPPCITYKQFT